MTQLRTNGVHCRESAGTGPLKVVPVTGAAILQVTMDQIMCASRFPHPLEYWYEVGMLIDEKIFRSFIYGGPDREDHTGS